MIQHSDFIEAVRRCVGTPVVHMGRTIGRALDCVGVPWAACHSLGMDLAPTRIYNAVPDGCDLDAGLAEFCSQVEDGGHLWQVFVGSQARHIVIPTGFNECGQQMVVHAWGLGRRSVIETIMRWRVARNWSIKGIE